MNQFEIIYVRFQDFDTKSYVSSQIELCRAFIKHGIRAVLIGLGRNERSDEFIHLFSDPSKPQLKKIMLMFRLMNYRKKKAVIVFDGFSVISALLLYMYRKIWGSQYSMVLDVRTIPVESKSRNALAAFRRNIYIAKIFCDGFTFITPGVKKMTESYSKKRFGKTHIFPSGTNADVFKPGLQKPGTELTMFYHGSITENRGVGNVLNALEQSELKIKWIVAGTGDENIINKLKAAQFVEYLGKLPYNEIPEHINQCDFTIIPLPDILWWRVSSPLKLMEYMACGKPIVLTDMEAHRNVIKDDSGVVWLKDMSSESIIDAIRNMESKLDLKRQEAAGLRTLIEKEFTYSSIAGRLLEFYAELEQ